jgi:protein involved in polysaccharide export with SLBB domain
MGTNVRYWIGVLLLLAVTACGGPDMAETVTIPEAEPYRLDSGDQLRVTVFGQEEMTGEYVVAGSGFISLPLLGQVEARGRTAEELEQEISERLRSQSILINPSVNVQVLTYRPFFILGQVAAPGQYPYVEGMTVLTAVAMAGGFTIRADTDDFTIVRKVGNKVIEGRAQRNTLVKPGDVVSVPERIF